MSVRYGGAASTAPVMDFEIQEDAGLAGMAVGDSLGIYLNEIGRYRMLTKEEEKETAIRARDGDLAARELLIVSNLRLVVTITKHFVHTASPSFMDAVQEGNLGLYRAAELFDVSRGYKFSTYACWWISQFVSRYISTQSKEVRLPAHAADRLIKVKKAMREEEALTGSMCLSPEELAQRAEVPVEFVLSILYLLTDPVSLNKAVGELGEETVVDFIKDDAEGPEEAALANDTNRKLYELLGTLQKREREVITLRYGLEGGSPHTLQEIGDMMGVTRERIRQIEKKAMAKLQRRKRCLE